MAADDKYTLLAYDEKGYADEGMDFTEQELVNMFYFLSGTADHLDASESDVLVEKLDRYLGGLLIPHPVPANKN